VHTHTGNDVGYEGSGSHLAATTIYRAARNRSRPCCCCCSPNRCLISWLLSNVIDVMMSLGSWGNNNQHTSTPDGGSGRPIHKSIDSLSFFLSCSVDEMPGISRSYATAGSQLLLLQDNEFLSNKHNVVL
jgi:hypothetical protein